MKLTVAVSLALSALHPALCTLSAATVPEISWPSVANRLRIPTNEVELVVYSKATPDHPLRVSYLCDDLDARPPVYTFPSSYSGNRVVVRVPDPTNAAICAWVGGETFKPGDPFGVRLSRDMRAIELTRTYPSFARIPYDYKDGLSDREREWGGTYTTSGTNSLGKLAMRYGSRDVEINPNLIGSWSIDDIISRFYTRIRVIRCRVDGQSVTQGSLNHRVIYDQYVPTASRGFICEYDVIGKGEYDIDWAHFDEIRTDPFVAGGLPITQVVYRVCYGEGDFPINTFTNSQLWIDVSRRFEVTQTVPTNLVATTRLGKTTFCWDMQTGRGQYSDTYTAFRIVVTGPTNYDSGLRFRPPHDNGKFKWTCPTTLSSGSYTWKVAMYNAKFQTDNWSTTSTFTIE